MLYAAAGPVEQLRETLLYTCRKKSRFDGMEDERFPYLFDVIHATGEPDFYQTEILNALQHPEPDDDAEQLYGLAMLFARNGSEQARNVLYKRFSRDAEAGDFSGAEYLVELDGIGGYVVVAEALSQNLPVSEDNTDHETALSALEKQVGRENPPAAWAMVYALKPELGTYLNTIRLVWSYYFAHHPISDREKQVPRPEPSKAMVRDRISRGGYFPQRLVRHLEPNFITELAHELTQETETTRITGYLSLFAKCPFPLNPEFLLTLLHHEDLKVAGQSAIALQHLRHPAVRETAHRIATDRRLSFLVPYLLVRNASEDDFALFSEILRRLEDENQIHHFGFGMNDYWDENPGIQGTAFLLSLYHKQSCSLCRGSIVRFLAQRNELPDWLCDEGIYDADSGIRTEVSRYRNAGHE